MVHPEHAPPWDSIEDAFYEANLSSGSSSDDDYHLALALRWTDALDDGTVDLSNSRINPDGKQLSAADMEQIQVMIDTYDAELTALALAASEEYRETLRMLWRSGTYTRCPYVALPSNRKGARTHLKEALVFGHWYVVFEILESDNPLYDDMITRCSRLRQERHEAVRGYIASCD